MDFNLLLEEIEKYDSIVIYRHENPDVDACGSQFGLKSWLEDNYPNKKVYAFGKKNVRKDHFLKMILKQKISLKIV